MDLCAKTERKILFHPQLCKLVLLCIVCSPSVYPYWRTAALSVQYCKSKVYHFRKSILATGFFHLRYHHDHIYCVHHFVYRCVRSFILWMGLSANHFHGNAFPQAVTATFKTDANSNALHESPSGTISKLVNKVAEVKKLNQPYASFGGKAVESKDDFYLRVSERLRHKQRAVDLWDYEHLVLQEFPEVYKVKCLNHSVLPADCACDFVKPGHVTLVLVPDVRNKNQFSPLEPKVSLDLITRIEDHLKELCSFFITPQVKNPVYEQVKLQFKIRFTTDGDFGFYADLLNNDLIKYLTPWAYSSDNDIVFGGHIRKSVLLNFIEELSYVDFVTEFNMYHVVNGSQGTDTDEIKISNPAAILVSHNQHLITAYQETEVCV